MEEAMWADGLMHLLRNRQMRVINERCKAVLKAISVGYAELLRKAESGEKLLGVDEAEIDFDEPPDQPPHLNQKTRGLIGYQLLGMQYRKREMQAQVQQIVNRPVTTKREPARKTTRLRKTK
jgi:hypothetical protein